MQSNMTTLKKSAWDLSTQEVHGGQTWRDCPNFICDFSVTTNAIGTPTSGLTAAREALSDIHHYPAADTSEAIDALKKFMGYDGGLLLGNGASEFIDLVMRVAPPGAVRTGPYKAAYMEYVRAGKASGRRIVKWDDAPSTQNGVGGGSEGREEEPAITIIIRPNSPTGDYMELEELEQVLQQTKGIVVLDESFIMFEGRNWKLQSGLSLLKKYPEKLMVLMSWTKFWACPGLRLGSIACEDGWYRRIKTLQTPWSCNSLAQKFFVAACQDEEYLENTWSTLPGWKKRMEERVRDLGWKVNEKSPAWVPWVFIDLGSKDVAAKATVIAQNAGCPVRNCASFGTPQYIRLGVRAPEHQDALFSAWKKVF